MVDLSTENSMMDLCTEKSDMVDLSPGRSLMDLSIKKSVLWVLALKGLYGGSQH